MTPAKLGSIGLSILSIRTNPEVEIVLPERARHGEALADTSIGPERKFARMAGKLHWYHRPTLIKGDAYIAKEARTESACDDRSIGSNPRGWPSTERKHFERCDIIMRAPAGFRTE